MDYLWHEVSEKEKEHIKKQAKAVIGSFSRKLSKIDKKIPEPVIERGEGERAEGKGERDKNFSRDIMFGNAPKKDKDFIIAEKKKW